MTSLLLQDLTIRQLERKVSESGSIVSSFEIEPLERGFGITLGNTLRRICLSHMEGTAVVAMRIPGVTHEFSTLIGVMEDTIEILLNLKSLVFRTDMTEQFTCPVKFRGPGEITGHHIELPAGVEIVNPDQLLATVTENIEFNFELIVQRGRGYILSSEHVRTNKAIDVIYLDASFMPIKNFSYRVEQTRVGETSEGSYNKYERLLLEIVSNGAIEPDKAISQAAKLLMQKLTPLMNLTGETMPVMVTPVAAKVEEKEEDSTLHVGIETLNLSVRAYNCLKRANKNTLHDLLQMTTDELMSIKNFGKKSAEEVIRVLNEHGHYLFDDPRRNNDPSNGQSTVQLPPHMPYFGHNMF